MKNVNIYDFRTHFAEYAKRVRAGETITLCDHNKPFAEVKSLGTAARAPAKRPIGLYKGKIVLSPDFDSRSVNKRIAGTFMAGSL
jgi:antitoxin (DNA-binding transcriptional repressor) of toxin-antitoxin stability system